MTDTNPALERGEQYIVFYKGGPYDGRDDPRISTDGTWDAELQVLVAVDGKETELTYTRPVARRVGEQVQVTYTWDQVDSEPFEDPEDRGEI
jgi:hypothetical protein